MGIREGVAPPPDVLQVRAHCDSHSCHTAFCISGWWSRAAHQAAQRAARCALPVPVSYAPQGALQGSPRVRWGILVAQRGSLEAASRPPSESATTQRAAYQALRQSRGPTEPSNESARWPPCPLLAPFGTAGTGGAGSWLLCLSLPSECAVSLPPGRGHGTICAAFPQP